jgi:hypothetical protein
LPGQINLTIIIIKDERKMKTAAVSELKACFSEYLNQMEAGVDVLVIEPTFL